MDDDGDVRTSTLVIGALGTIAVGIGGTLIAELAAPRLVHWASLPAVVFLMIFVLAHRRRSGRR